MLDVVLPLVHGTVGHPLVENHLSIQYVLEHTDTVQLLGPVSCPLAAQIVSSGRFKAEDGLFLSHSYLTQCRQPDLPHFAILNDSLGE